MKIFMYYHKYYIWCYHVLMSLSFVSILIAALEVKQKGVMSNNNNAG